MKYIRTKDGIFEVDIEHRDMIETGFNDKGLHQYFGNTIIAQADTIGELCDWIVFKLNGKIKALYDNWDVVVQCEGNHISIYEEIYGAIETDKGLIYVAKTNDKGELCLL